MRGPTEVGEEDDLGSVGRTKLKKSCHRYWCDHRRLEGCVVADRNPLIGLFWLFKEESEHISFNELADLVNEGMCFQQDSVTCHFM